MCYSILHDQDIFLDLNYCIDIRFLVRAKQKRQGKTSILSSNTTKLNALSTAPFQTGLGALLYNLLYACL